MTTTRRIPVAEPTFGAEEERAAVDVLRSGWVTQGPRVEALERRFAAVTGAAEAVAVSSGTTALFLALHALGVGPGDEVIVPSLSFIATANPVVHCGATPVLVDVDPRTYNVDPAAVEAAVTPRTRAVIVVHQLGLPADVDALAALARRHDLRLIEDAACAIGARYKGRPIGGLGHVAAFSFHPRKVVVAGEGGMITTDDGALAARLRCLRHQGMSVSDVERHRADRVITETYPEIGYNFRLSDLHAAVALAQLDKLDRLLAGRREVAQRYAAALAGIDAVEPPFVPEWAVPNWQSYIVRLRGFDEAARDRVLDGMLRRGVATRRGLMAIHQEPCYRGARTGGPLLHSEAAAAETMILPIYAHLAADEQDRVVDALRATLAEVRPAAGAAGGRR